jgi:hypothetical protein
MLQLISHHFSRIFLFARLAEAIDGLSGHSAKSTRSPLQIFEFRNPMLSLMQMAAQNNLAIEETSCWLLFMLLP